MNVMELFATLSLDSSGFMTALYGAGQLVATVGKALVGFAADSIETGKEFDVAMSQIAATMGMSSKDIQDNVNGAGDTFDLLRQKALEMGSATMYTAQESAEGLNILAMSGYDAADSVAMIEDVLHLAAAGSMDLASSAAYISGSMKGFADETKDAQYYADLFAMGATMANTSVSQLGDAFSAGAATFASYNQNAESAGVALLRLAEQGTTGSEAATKLSRTMADLYTPTADAEKAMKQLGVSAYDSAGNARDVNDVVDDLNKALSGMSDAQALAYKSTIFTSLGMKGFNEMTVTSTEKVEEWRDTLANASGSAALQYDTMTDNLQGDLDAFGSAVDGLKIAISDSLTDSLRMFVKFGTESVGSLTAAFNEGGIQGVASAIAGIFQNAVSMALEYVPELVSTIKVLGGAFITAAIELLPEIVATGKELIAGLFGTSDPMTIITAAFVAVQTFIEGIFQNAGAVYDRGMEILTWLIDGIVEYLPQVWDMALETISNFASGIIENLPQILESGAHMLLKLIEGVQKTFPQMIAKAVEVVVQFAKTVQQNLPQILETGFRLMGEFIAGMIRNFPNVLSAGLQIISSLKSLFVDTDWAQLGIDIITGIANGIGAAASIVWDAAKSAAKGILDAFIDFFEIGSPSKLMRREAKWIPAGAALGVEDGIPLVTDAMAELDDAVTGGYDISGARGTGGGGGLTQIINVNQPIATADELARTLRIESRYGLMTGGSRG